MSTVKTDAEKLSDAQAIIRQKNLEIKDLGRSVERLQKEADLTAKHVRTIWGLTEHPVSPPVWVSGKGGKIGSRGCPITIWSDFHYGERVFEDQVNGLNNFNCKVAHQRIRRLVDTTIDLSFNHMGRAKTEYPGAIVCLGGDMITGDIHEELMATNDRTTMQSVNDLTDYLGAALDKMASAFGRVFVPCVVGNHGRSTKKLPMKNRVHTSFDYQIYSNLERYFRKDKNVVIHIPSTADATFNVFGTRYILTHGDSLGVRGGDGIIGAVGPIMRGTLKLRNSEMQRGRDFDVAVMGHWHQMLWLPGCIVNNSLKGYDEFAMLGLRAPYSRPSQALWFNHPEHGITARWEIFLEGNRRFQPSKEWVTWQT